VKKFVREAIHSIKDEIDQLPLGRKTSEEMAGHASISRNILQKGFKKIFTLNIQEYRHLKRMEAAGVLIDAGELTMKQVAYKCGYSAQGNFSFAFKKIYGLTPTEFQNRA